MLNNCFEKLSLSGEITGYNKENTTRNGDFMYRVLDHLVNYAHQTAWQSGKEMSARRHDTVFYVFVYLLLFTVDL